MLSIARNIKRPIISKGKTYEVDEVRTFVKRKDKLIWIVCALERSSKKIVSFTIGPRTNKTLNVVIKTLAHADAKRIYTDGLQNYRYLIEPKAHKVDQYATNHIERKKPNLAYPLKKIEPKNDMLYQKCSHASACLTIYFFS